MTTRLEKIIRTSIYRWIATAEHQEGRLSRPFCFFYWLLTSNDVSAP